MALKALQLQPGSVVAIPVWPGVSFLPFRHLGIVTDTNWISGPRIISCSLRQGGVTEESVEEFSNGAPVTVVAYPGNLHPDEVIARARSRLGTPWNLFTFNCEHFVNWAHGLKPESPQLQAAAVVFVLAFLGIGRFGSRSV